jgi:hypothetical protein
MGDKSLYLKNQVLNAALVPGNSLTGSSSGKIFVSLHSGSAIYTVGINSGSFNTTTEITGSGYARQEVVFASASNGQTGNTNEISFGISSGTYGPTNSIADTGYVTHFALCSHNTGSASGHVVFYADALANPQIITVGNEAKFVSGAITVSES